MIHYFSENISFKLNNKRVLSHWIKNIILSHGYSLKILNFIFVNDDYILDINQRFLGHNFYTDVITFDTSHYSNFSHTSDSSVSADIFISIDTVLSNSKLFQVSFDNELYRVMIHGVLHLIGFDDLSAADSLKMKEQENIALLLLSNEN